MRRRSWVVPTGAIAVVVVLAAIVALVGGTLLALSGGEDGHAKPSARITVFIRDTATPAQIKSLEARIRTAPGVERYQYITKQETLSRLADGRPEVMLPDYMAAASYMIRLKNGAAVYPVAQQLFRDSAVRGVWVPRLGSFPARSGIEGRVLTVGGPAPGAPRPYPASEVKVIDSAGSLVAIMSPDSNGAFRIALFPGNYTVVARPTAGNPWFRPEHVSVEAGGYSKVNVYAQIR
jgi:hypothetical protein